jgi:hypothetical protein
MHFMQIMHKYVSLCSRRQPLVGRGILPDTRNDGQGPETGGWAAKLPFSGFWKGSLSVRGSRSCWGSESCGIS